MILKLISIDLNDYPVELHKYFYNSDLYDSSSSPAAKVIFIDKGKGLFLKIAKEKSLETEFIMTNYFSSLNLSANVVEYIRFNGKDYLLTEKIIGEDCVTQKYLDDPKKLAKVLGESLFFLHSQDYTNCPIQNRTELLIKKATDNYEKKIFDTSCFGDLCPNLDIQSAYNLIKEQSPLLKTDTLLHGDYCLPNIFLKDWKLTGFIDFDVAGVGDRNYDLFWGGWTMHYNLKTDKYTDYFYSSYGKEKVNKELFPLIATICSFE